MAGLRPRSCIPHPGAEGLRQALAYLGGAKVEKKVVVGTEAITIASADAILVRNGLKQHALDWV